MQKLSTNTSTEIEDDITSFGNHVKSVLRKLHPRLKVQANNEIFNVLTKYEVIEMNMLEERSLSSGISNPSTFMPAYSPSSTASTSEPTNLTVQTQNAAQNEENY
ncbi:hypothetical protein ANN_17399 [Periplaneta americana]|uniref:Uncharacterized protein n=1 Tax=Periplaneta americana TaxID=6978 RepID=A0ABQ8SSU5_PERAM|nr:hypothetical protein ANN_17399 [Periplaneta americana]